MVDRKRLLTLDLEQHMGMGGRSPDSVVAGDLCGSPACHQLSLTLWFPSVGKADGGDDLFDAESSWFGPVVLPPHVVILL